MQKLNIECLIDDLPRFLNPLSGSGLLLIWLKQPWNIGMSIAGDIAQANNWKEIYEIVNTKTTLNKNVQ